MTRHRNPDPLTWRIEVSDRAAWLTETLPRDLRWFLSLW